MRPGKAGDCSSGSLARGNLSPSPGPRGASALSLEMEVATLGSASPLSTVLGTVGYRVSLGNVPALRSLVQSISKQLVEHVHSVVSVIFIKW